MTLKEKFDKCKDAKNQYYVIPITDDSKQLVEITEDFAIGFADWIRVCKLKGRPYDFENVKKLLEIYKKEKEL
jgi:hypothetical protein